MQRKIYLSEGSSSAVVDLGESADAEFALTLWYSSEGTPPAAPLVAELSYKYETAKGEVSGPSRAAR
jgi:hypothetical protein